MDAGDYSEIRLLFDDYLRMYATRDDAGYWHQVEAYIHAHTEAEFSHGLCPECSPQYFPQTQEMLPRGNLCG